MFKQGDRVRYRWVGPNGNVDRNGREGTVETVDSENAYVSWDDGRGGGVPYLYNLELIEMTKTIDTTKPLTAVNSRGPLDVTFITETSEGHILVDLSGPDSFVSGWYMFDKQGQFVRSHKPDPRHGSGIVLSNKVVDVVKYQRAINDIGNEFGYIVGNVYDSEQEARGLNPNAPIVRTTSREGRIIAVELIS